MSKGVLLKLENVGVSFRQGRNLLNRAVVEVLHDISFSLFSGESLGVIGRNGVGKSTLLKLMAGIIAPNQGVVKNHGTRCTLLNLQLGFKLDLTGADNIYLMGILYGLTRRKINQRLDAILDFSELGDAIYKPVKTYSAGMRARLGFSVALQMNTDVLLVDEILGVGDIEFREKSSAAMQEMLRSDQTIVLVSHQAQTIKNLCDRVIWIEGGHIKSIGPPEEVVTAYEKYVLGKRY
jgi:lipopolysaccharide transport system ATP-binding protein